LSGACLVELEPLPEGVDVGGSVAGAWGAAGLPVEGVWALSSAGDGVERVPTGAFLALSAGTVAVLPPVVGEAGAPERGAFAESSVLPGVGCGAELLPMPVGLEVVLPEGGAPVCARAAAARQRDATRGVKREVRMKSSSFESGVFTDGADRGP
jgi:hypothetical protein